MPYSKLSTKISNYLAGELDYSQEKRDILAYSLDSLVVLIANFAAIMAAGWLIGVPKAAFLAILAGGLLRMASGGAHFSRPLPCMVFGAAVYSLLGWTGVKAFTVWGNEKYFGMALLAMCLMSLLITGLFAPVDSEAKPIVSQDFRRRLRYRAILTVLFFSFLSVIYKDSYIGACMVAGLTYQSMTLLPFLNDRKNKEVEI